MSAIKFQTHTKQQAQSEQNWVSSTVHEAPHYVVFSTPFYLVPPRPKYSPKYPYSKKILTYVTGIYKPLEREFGGLQNSLVVMVS